MRSSTVIKIAAAIGCSVGELYDDYNNCGDSNTIVCPNCGVKLELRKKE